MSITIKRADSSGLSAIAKLFDAYRVFYKQKSDQDLALKFITQRFENNESVIFFAEDDNKTIIGFTQLYPIFSSVSAQRTWLLNDLFVTPEIRSNGVGTKLLNRAKDFALETGAKGIALETSHDNVRAQKLYESLGYKKNSEYAYFLSATT